ncbi:hypothetical protein AGOR_G00160350 [Albula goreensis]|uniref:J domain-containing protein n=1 Tax=Albula goreensis TaxID=1534307 RepID=A0A8T3D0D3_9TELE|nr:hypothetical protein AGOR_G00160350 [Albula goreensis]
MDKPGSAGRETQERTPGPQGYSCGGSSVGNGVCHGPSLQSVLDPAPPLKTGEDAEGGDRRQTSADVKVETCGAFIEGWQGEEEKEEKEGEEHLHGREEPGEGEAQLSVKELLDIGLRKTVKEPYLGPPSMCSGSVSSGALGHEEGEEGGAWQSAWDDLEPPSSCPGDPSLEEDEGGSGHEGDGSVNGNKDLGQDELEGLDRADEEEEGDDEDRDVRNDEGRDSRTGGDLGPRRPGGGKRGRGRVGAGEPLSTGGRHKQARRRNHHHHHQGRSRGAVGSRVAIACRELLTESVRPWCMSCLRMVVELIVLVAHRCGEAVEAGGMTLYDSGSSLLRKATDLPMLKAEARGLLGRAWHLGADLADRAKRTTKFCWGVGACCLGLLCSVLLLSLVWARGLLRRLSGERGQRWWASFRDSRVWKGMSAILEKVSAVFGRGSHQASPCSVGRGNPGEELQRLLELAQIPEDQLDPFAVLGVEASASDTELKKAYRQLAVQVHPDKNKHPRAGEAFKVLRAAWDVVSNPETRREYELKRMAETELSRSMNEFLIKLQDDLKEAMNTMMCTKCEGKHKRFEMERDPSEARFCAECNKRHGAEEGDFWAESSMLGLRITYFAFMDGKVYDITEWAGCQRIGISPDTHRVPYHISFGSKNSSTATRHRTPSDPSPGPSSPADLQDFFNRIFQGGAPNGMATNGGFFPSGPPPHHPPGAGPGPGGPFPASPPHTGFFAPGGQRADPGEPRTEAGKPPRRRKKVRKPFQR